VWLDSLVDIIGNPGYIWHDTIYLRYNENDRKGIRFVRRDDYRLCDDIKAKYPLHNFQRSAKNHEAVAERIKIAFGNEVLQKSY
jgi:Xaa-Pro aminopeptidase